jgi:hypothetical protein
VNAARTNGAARSTGTSGSAARGLAFALGGALLAGAYLAGLQLPWIHSDRDAFVGLVALGWLGCMAGAGATVARMGWTHPIVLAGASMGVAAMVAIVLTLTGWGGPMLWLSSGARVTLDRAGVCTLACLLAAKGLLGIASLAPKRF